MEYDNRKHGCWSYQLCVGFLQHTTTHYDTRMATVPLLLLPGERMLVGVGAALAVWLTQPEPLTPSRRPSLLP